jgi:hypothetical protein
MSAAVAAPAPALAACTTSLRFRDAVTVTWKLRGVKLDELRMFPSGVAMRSADFTLDGCSAWYMRLYPGGDAAAAAKAAALKKALRAHHGGADTADDEEETGEAEGAMTLHVCCADVGAHEAVSAELTATASL